MKKQRLAIFASGNGSNAVRLIEYFRNHEKIEVAAVLTNNKNAGVIDRVKEEPVSTMIIDNQLAQDGKYLTALMETHRIDFIILGGYLRKIPGALIEAFPNKIINLHPALLPKFGGKGMYGKFVHQAVLDAREKETGITVHLVNQNYDEGRVLAQHKTAISPDDDALIIREKVQKLEHEWFPGEVEKYITGNF